MFYEIKTKRKQLTEKGVEREVKEQYITDCELFAEAERKGLEIHNGAADVTHVTRSTIIEIVNPDGTAGNYYRATLVNIFTDEDGTEKETKYHVLINAADITDANKKAHEYMRQGLNDMRLDSITKSKIIQIL